MEEEEVEEDEEEEAEEKKKKHETSKDKHQETLTPLFTQSPGARLPGNQAALYDVTKGTDE